MLTELDLAPRFAAGSADPGLRALLDGTAPQHDLVPGQVAELAEVRAPGKDLDEATARQLAGSDGPERGTWVHYRWQPALVRVLERPAFQELRSSRNRWLIDDEEQRALGALKIGVVGLSVGRSAAALLAQEGVGGHFRLADMDTLQTSNLNRVQAPLWEVGENKAVLCARQLLAIDPYLELRVFPEGLQRHNLDSFFGAGAAQLDLVVEECDDLAMKVLVRERARQLGVPVLMATSERGMLDIERFDLQPHRPLFHGRLGDVTAGELEGLSKRDKVPHVLRILGAEHLSDRTIASLLEIDSTLVTWPQLASEVTLGAALVTDAARRITLGHLQASGRFLTDLSALVQDGMQVGGTAEAAVLTPAAAPSNGPVTAQRGDPLALSLVEAAGAAPSGGNLQPWTFHWQDLQLSALLDRERLSPLLDFRQLGTFLGFGAAAENVALRAADHGFKAEITAFPQHARGDMVFTANLQRSPGAAPDPLASNILLRCTDRHRGARLPVDPELRARMGHAAQARGARLLWRDDAETLEELGHLLGEADRLRLLHPQLHAELMAELRFDAATALQTRDGIDVQTLALRPDELAGLRLMRRPGAMRALARMFAGKRLGRLSEKAVEGASAMGLLCVPRREEKLDFFAGGRAIQRAWLQATADGIGFQPMSAVTYVWLRVEAGGEGLDPANVARYAELRRRFNAIWEVPDGWRDIMMFRIHRGGPAPARALRRDPGTLLRAT